MAQKYDEFTSSWIDGDENESVKEQTAGENSKKKRAEDVIQAEPVKRLNKKAVMTILIVVAVTLCLYRLLPEKKEVVKKEKQPASEIIVPDFGDYKNRKYQEVISVPSDIELTNEVDVPVSYKPVSYGSPKNYDNTNRPQRDTPVYVQTPQVDDMTSRVAELSANIQWLDKPASAAKNNLSNSPNSYGNPLMSPNEYLNSRLAGLPLGTSGNNTESESSYVQQNMQGDKKDFYTANSDNFLTGSYIGDDTLWLGTIIPAVLLTGISTDNPGIIKAQVTENIYDSISGTKILIPQGSTLIAEYNSYISYAQKRVQIAWNTLIRPDGFQLDLTNMPGTDSQGISGIKGRVNEHIWEYLKAMGIVTVFSAINAGVSDTINTMNSLQNFDNDYAQNLMAQNQNVINQLGGKLIDRAMDIQPTINIANGTKVNIFVNKNLTLPPLPVYPVNEAYKRN